MTKENNKANSASAKVAKVSSQIKAATVEAEEKSTAIKVNTKNASKPSTTNPKNSSSVAVKIQKPGAKQTNTKSSAKSNSSRQATGNTKKTSSVKTGANNRAGATTGGKKSSKTAQNSRILSVVEFGDNGRSRANTAADKAIDDATKSADGYPEKAGDTKTKAAHTSKKKSSSKKKNLIILSIILIIGLIAGVAVWLFNRNNRSMCTVDFESNGGTKVESVEVVCGGKISQPKDPEKDGFDFREWSYRGRKFNFNDSTVSEDMILVAKWDAAEDTETVTIRFDANGGSEVEDIVIKAGTATMAPVDPVRDGYAFDGWYLGNEKFDFSEAINEDVTLVAHWSGGSDSGNNNSNSGDSRPSTPSTSGTQNSGTQQPVPDTPTSGGSTGGTGSGNGSGDSGNTGGDSGNTGGNGSGDGGDSTTTPGGDNNSNVPNPDDSSQNQP